MEVKVTRTEASKGREFEGASTLMGPAVEDISIVNKFDVRPYPPAKRHDMVFDAFDELKPGEAFVFINDHDPKSLYYQIEAESDEPFKWEYLETMPREWKVKVMKTLD